MRWRTAVLPERPAAAGSGGSVRRYGEGDRRRLRFIKAAQTAGFTLGEIGELLALDATDDRARAREMARSRMAGPQVEHGLPALRVGRWPHGPSV